MHKIEAAIYLSAALVILAVCISAFQRSPIAPARQIASANSQVCHCGSICNGREGCMAKRCATRDGIK